MEKQQMEAEVIFDNPETRDLAIPEFTKRGYEVEILDWVDEDEGVIYSETVWIKVRGTFDGDDNEFFNEMHHLSNQLGGDVVEAGYQSPQLAQAHNDRRLAATK